MTVSSVSDIHAKKSSEHLRIFLLMVFLTVGVVVALSPFFWTQLSDNEGCYATTVQQMNRGSLLYLNLINNKPPALFWQYMAAFKLTGTWESALRIYAMACHAAVACGLLLIGKKLGQGIGATWSAAIYPLFLLFPLYQPWQAQADLLMLPALLTCFLLILEENPLFWLLSGLCWAFSLLTKQSALFFLPAVAVLVPPPRRVKTAFMFGIGAFTLFLANVLWLLSQGTLQSAITAFAGTGSGYGPRNWYYALHDPTVRNSLLWVVGLRSLIIYGPFAALGFCAWRSSPPFIRIWLFAAFVSFSTNGNFLAYYFLAMLPPLALMSGPPLERAWRQRRLATGGILAAWACTLALLAWPMWTQPVQAFREVVNKDHFHQGAREAGLKLKSLAATTDRLMVWGYSAQMHIYSGLSTSAVHTLWIEHLLLYPDEMEATKMRFLANPPSFVALQDNLGIPAIPGWLSDEVAKSYSSIGVYGSDLRFNLYRRGPQLSRH